MGNQLAVRNPDKLNLWIERIRTSGMTVTEWCSQNGISVKSYYYWHNRISKMYSPECDTGPQQFYDVANSASSASTCGSVTVTIHVGGYSADVYSGADEATLAAVCRALRSC